MNCVICGFEKTKDLKFKNIKLSECPNCGMVFSDIPKIEYTLNEYYKNHYVIKHEDKFLTEARRIANIPEQVFLLSILNKYKSQPANFLDFGCDHGFLLEEARRFGFNVAGIELSENSAQYARNNGLTIYNNIESLKEKFDIVTMNHSLEHLSEPVQFLDQLQKKMAKDSIISIRVPDFGCFWSKILKSKWIWFQPHNHYFHYTIKSLSYLLENNGFDIIFIRNRKPKNCKTYNANRLANSVYKKYFGKKQSFRNKLGFFYSWFTGSEIFALAKKKAD